MKTTILGLLLLVTACMEYVDPRAEAQRWAEEMSYEFAGCSCSDRDSDHDGYVSCSVRLKEHEDVALECGYLKGRGGCKMAVAKVRVQSVQ